LIVVDTSIWLDLFREGDLERIRLAEKFFEEIERLTIYEPQVFRIELAGVLARYYPRDEVERFVNNILNKISLCKDLEEKAYKVALSTGSRAIDAYFIACASSINSILVSNDKIQVNNARKYGIEAYYLLKEYNAVLNRIKDLIK